MDAVARDQFELVKFLILSGANCDLKDNLGNDRIFIVSIISLTFQGSQLTKLHVNKATFPYLNIFLN
jgi:hypothetical protein